MAHFSEILQSELQQRTESFNRQDGICVVHPTVSLSLKDECKGRL